MINENNNRREGEIDVYRCKGQREVRKKGKTKEGNRNKYRKRDTQ